MERDLFRAACSQSADSETTGLNPMIDSLSTMLSATQEPNIWVNVSSLMRWDRPPVGILRVEQEYCRWLIDANSPNKFGRIRFCEAVAGERRFVEVSHERVRAKLLCSGSGWPDARQPAAMRMKRTIRSLLPYLPAPALGVLRRVRTAMARLKACMTLPLRWLIAGRGADIQMGDYWVSLGLDWLYLDQDWFLRFKQERQLRTTTICYDIIPLLYPQFVLQPPQGFASYLALLTHYSDQVLCISRSTQRDYLKAVQQMGIDSLPPTHVVTLGADIPLSAAAATPPKAFAGDHATRPFVLYVSTIERRKNHALLYQAWARMREDGFKPYRLVFVGRKGYGVGELLNDIQLDPRTSNDILILDHANDAELVWLYRHAAFTVYPSLYEGWGLPVVESLCHGKFCLASGSSSLPEAGGEWAEYIDPMDVISWARRLLHYMENPGEIQARNESIAAHLKPTTWAQTSEQIHQKLKLAGCLPRQQASQSPKKIDRSVG